MSRSSFMNVTRPLKTRLLTFLAAIGLLFIAKSSYARCNLSIVLDLTGSMNTMRTTPDGGTGFTRCHDAIEIARETVTDFQNGSPFVMDNSRGGGGPDPLASQFMGTGFNYASCPTADDRFVQIVTVSGTANPGGISYLAPAGPVPVAPPASAFAAVGAALAALNALAPATACTGSTPLADAICVAGRGFLPDLMSYVPGVNVMKILTDGMENNSQNVHLEGLVRRTGIGNPDAGIPFLDCRGIGDIDDSHPVPPPFAANSWQQHVITFLSGDILFSTFINVPIDIFNFFNDPLLNQRDVPFFQTLSASFGGSYVEIDDGPGVNPNPEQGDSTSAIVIAGSTNTATSLTCNGPLNAACTLATAMPPPPPGGAAFNTTMNCGADVCSPNIPLATTYTFTDWRDVLRVLLAGMDHSTVAMGTGAAAWAARYCDSPLRRLIADNYGNFFENMCAAPAGETATTVCTQLRHVFRPDDASVVTNTLVALLGLPPIVPPESTPLFTNHTGATPFCNAVRPSFVFPVPQPTCPVGSDNTWDPTVCVAQTPSCSNPSVNICFDPLSGRTKEKGMYRVTMQDNDPIRRACVVGREQVCPHGPAASRSLGLVLPMNDVPEPAPFTNADRYNATPCGSPNRFAAGPLPQIYDNVTQALKIGLTGAICPNGDTAPTGGCIIPASSSTGPKCLAALTNSPALTNNTTPVPLINPAGPGVANGLQYNQHLYALGATGSALYQTNPFPVTGAYYRIHSTTSFPTSGRTCQMPIMLDQIACLADSSPCSLGITRLDALTGAILAGTQVDGVKVNAQNPIPACIPPYPL